MTKITLRRQGRTLALRDDDGDLPLLDRVENAGGELSFGCRGGSCGVCRVEVLRGGEFLSERGFIEEDTLGRCFDPPTVRLACQARVVGEGSAATAEIEIDPAPEVVLPEE